MLPAQKICGVIFPLLFTYEFNHYSTFGRTPRSANSRTQQQITRKLHRYRRGKQSNGQVGCFQNAKSACEQTDAFRG